MHELSNTDWEDILDTLEGQKCILFLGSGAYKAPGGGSIEESLGDWLDIKNPNNPHIRLCHPDGFLLYRKKRFKRKVISKIRAYYNQNFPESEQEFTKLVKIPFTTIVTLTPDNILARAFEKYGLDYQADFYFRQREASEYLEKPTWQKPLVYNLLGNIEEPESLVLTHEDFFNYLDSVFKGNSMNEDLLHELENAERYIFLGLPYEKWYFQLLLRVLSMHSDKLGEVEKLALKEFEIPHLHKLYTEEFKIEFIPTEISLFIDKIYEKCEKSNILRELSSPNYAKEIKTNLTFENITNLIVEAKTDDAMDQLKILFDRQKPYNQENLYELAILRNRYHLLKQRDRRGTIYSQDFVIENSQIIEQLLKLTSHANAL